MVSTSTVLNSIHGATVFGRRVRILANMLAREIPRRAHLLDVGTGDGSIAAAIAMQRRDVEIEGIDVLLRPHTKIPVRSFDGEHIPFDSKSFDVVSLVDVLHHTADPQSLLSEAARVTRRYVLIKDHLREGALAGVTLRMMDWVGNYGHKVVLPYNYLSELEWRRIFQNLKLEKERWSESLGLYPFPFSIAFGRRLHFVALLRTP
jgi:ubiquinone/menaquinone biosynthesis C-methylase UbiE